MPDKQEQQLYRPAKAFNQALRVPLNNSTSLWKARIAYSAVGEMQSQKEKTSGIALEHRLRRHRNLADWGLVLSRKTVLVARVLQKTRMMDGTTGRPNLVLMMTTIG